LRPPRRDPQDYLFVTLKVVFFGNSQSAFSNRHFRALMETRCALVGLVDVPPSKQTSTNPSTTDLPSFVEVGHQHRIPVFEPDGPNSPEFVKGMSDLVPDLLLAVGYPSLLKEQILSVPCILAANFHASLLPAYRGKHPVFWTLRHGERWTGLTVHAMDLDLDTGDILYQVRVRTRKRDTVATLYDRIMERSVNLVGQLIKDAEKGTLQRTPQPESGASYYSSVSEDDFRLDWSWDAEQLRRWIQTTPGQCFSHAAGRRLFFIDAEVVETSANDMSPGVLIRIGRTSSTLAAGRGALRVRRVRLAQAEEKSMPQLCRELGLEPGDCLA
jgi:methionyl-tRNA formyltransferase